MDYEKRAREIIDAASASEGVIREVDYDLALEAIDEALRESYEAGRADNEADTSAALRSIAPGDAVIVGGYSCVPETWLRESYEAGLEAGAVVCDEYARRKYAAVHSNEFDDGQAVGAEACADEIRALKEGGA